jgi:pimeloyl-ACP methyl ester carboxylesterase
MSTEDTRYLDRPDGARVAYIVREGKSPGVVWLGGFNAAMDGNKARALDAWAVREGRALVRFDYFGHGQSTGQFRNGTVSRWRDDALAILDRLTAGPQVLVGSSMGAWIAFLVAAVRPERVAGFLLIAPAIDFVDALWTNLPPEAKRQIEETGEWLRPSTYGPDPYPITRGLIEDGRNLSGQTPRRIRKPIRILQGMRDPDVPWQRTLKLVEGMEGDVRLSLVREGDHRLSKPDELRLIERELAELIADVAPP